MEWRQTLLDLNKFVIYNVAIGDDATIDIIKKNSRWQVEGGKWLKSASASEALNVLRRHLNILDPKVTEDLAPKLHLLGLRSVADTVRQWVNEAIIPDRHYRPPPKKGSDKVARNESKERAKAEEVRNCDSRSDELGVCQLRSKFSCAISFSVNTDAPVAAT